MEDILIMDNKYIVEDKIEINASLSNVWIVLTKTEYYKQWDDLPENFTDETLELGKIINWEGYSKLTVIEYEVNKIFSLSLFLPKLNMKPGEYNIAYKFILTDIGKNVRLDIKIGDFTNIPNGKEYYDASIDFANKAKIKIKELAEQINKNKEM
jgi:hypothetical protein